MDKKPIIPCNPKALGEILANRLFSFLPRLAYRMEKKK
jgi:hypothetical protein